METPFFRLEEIGRYDLLGLFILRFFHGYL